VHPLARERVERDGERAGERLALAGLHLGDVAAVQHHRADELDVEVPHAHGAPAGLAGDREALGEDIVQGDAVVLHPLPEDLEAGPQFVVGFELQLRLEGADRGDALLVLTELLGLAHVERAVE
jgi:hypothetical protein